MSPPFLYPYVTADEVAEHLGVSRASVYKLLAIGLPSVKLGRSRRFRLGDVDAWVYSRQAAA